MLNVEIGPLEVAILMAILFFLSEWFEVGCKDGKTIKPNEGFLKPNPPRPPQTNKGD